MHVDDGAQKTLFRPLETGDLPLPQQGERILILGAQAGLRPPEGFEASLTLVQGFRPAFLALRASGYTVLPEPQGEDYAQVFLLAEKHRGLNETRIAEALRRVGKGGTIIVAGAKEDGIASLRKRIQTLTPIAGSVSKHHGIAFWFTRPADASAIATMLDHPNRPALIDSRYSAAPGMFSHDRIDAGSRLLAANLPTDLSGEVADFCAGWGYLASTVLERSTAVTALHLYEADHASLQAARLNLASATPEVQFHWQDLTREPVPRRFDAIVMNPPFHVGHAAQPGIGETMIKAASAALKPGGRLFMVANRGLPYEKPMAAQFRRSGETLRDTMYKLLWAVR